MDDWGLAAPAASAASSAAPILVAALGIGAVGGIFGYLTKGRTGALVGGVVGALLGGVAGGYVGQPQAATTTISVLPAGPYTLLGAGATLQPGETYLVSLANPSGQPTDLTAGVAALVAAGFPVQGSWNAGQTPPGWPPGDPNAATGIHVALTNSDSVAHKLGSNAVVWTTGGATT